MWFFPFVLQVIIALPSPKEEAAFIYVPLLGPVPLWHCAKSKACIRSSPNWLLRIGSAEPHSAAGMGPRLLLALLANYLLLTWCFFLCFL